MTPAHHPSIDSAKTTTITQKFNRWCSTEERPFTEQQTPTTDQFLPRYEWYRIERYLWNWQGRPLIAAISSSSVACEPRRMAAANIYIRVNSAFLPSHRGRTCLTISNGADTIYLFPWPALYLPTDLTFLRLSSCRSFYSFYSFCSFLPVFRQRYRRATRENPTLRL